MKNIDNYTSNKEARNKILKESSEIVADEMRKLQEQEDEKKREEGIKENSNELIIKIRDLKMNFGTKEVLKGINLDIHKGEIIGYIGTNGAGKSTTVKIMLGLISGYTGTVEIFGENILKSDGSYKRKIGYVPEMADIYDTLTAKEYLTFMGQLYGMEYKDVLYKSKQLMKILEFQAFLRE